ncbi:MAG TPA: hypothetical protein VG650_01915 [Mycobacteriales bacterium]|nr:hypothetical protein [Mycobacteriales bacterium]
MKTVRRRSEDLDFPEYSVIAYIHDGRYAAFAAAIAVLHARGLLVAGRSGRLRRNEDANTGPSNSFERSIWRAIHGSVAPGTLVADPLIDSLLNGLRRRCHDLGLIHALVPTRLFTPSRTPAGRGFLELAVRNCPWPPPENATSSPEQVGLSVALYGNDALKTLMPGFARDSGLLDREREDPSMWDPKALGPQNRYY